ARCGDEARASGAGALPVACAPLADPARALHLPRATPALCGLPDQRSLPLAGEDNVHHLVSRLRRSYPFAAPAFANVGTKGTLELISASAALDLTFLQRNS